MKSLEENLKSNDLKFAELNEKQNEFKEKLNELQVEMEDIRMIVLDMKSNLSSLSKNMESILKLQEKAVQANKVAATTSIDVASKDVRTLSSGDGVLGPPPSVVNHNGQAYGNNLGQAGGNNLGKFPDLNDHSNSNSFSLYGNFKIPKLDFPNSMVMMFVDGLGRLDEVYENVVGEFNKLQQTGSVMEYQEKFEDLQALVLIKNNKLDEGYFVDSFISGLNQVFSTNVCSKNLVSCNFFGKITRSSLENLQRSYKFNNKPLYLQPEAAFSQETSIYMLKGDNAEEEVEANEEFQQPGDLTVMEEQANNTEEVSISLNALQ
ncbi:hypothetical protein FRX31_015203, partial [Thalictrum thalictroides]